MIITASHLEKLHTKVLLRALRLTRDVPYWWYEERKTDLDVVSPFLIGGSYMDESTVTVSQLKDELAKRPHVPNKQEGRLARRKRAKQGRQRGRRDR